jgi:hypothetical protein
MSYINIHSLTDVTVSRLQDITALVVYRGYNSSVDIHMVSAVITP